jgi:hypothetical protein
VAAHDVAVSVHTETLRGGLFGLHLGHDEP